MKSRGIWSCPAKEQFRMIKADSACLKKAVATTRTGTVHISTITTTFDLVMEPSKVILQWRYTFMTQLPTICQPTRRSYLDKNLGNQLRRLAREQCSIIGINQRKRGEITSNIIDINKKIEAVLSKTLEGLRSWLFANQRIALLYWTTRCFRLSK